MRSKFYGVSKIFCTVILAFFLLGNSTTVFAAIKNPPKGFRGIKFGDPLSKHIATLVPADDWNKRINEPGSIHEGVFYRCSKDKMSIGDAKVDDIVYMFCDNRFASAALIVPFESLQELLDVCKKHWGIPEFSEIEELQFSDTPTIARWYNDDVICLLSDNGDNDMCLSIVCPKYIKFNPHSRDL